MIAGTTVLGFRPNQDDVATLVRDPIAGVGGLSFAPMSALLERNDLLAALASLAQEARSRGCTVLVGGEAGIGQTALLERPVKLGAEPARAAPPAPRAPAPAAPAAPAAAAPRTG